MGDMMRENATEIIRAILADYERRHEREKKALESTGGKSPRYAISRYAELLRLETAVTVLEYVVREIEAAAAALEVT